MDEFTRKIIKLEEAALLPNNDSSIKAYRKLHSFRLKYGLEDNKNKLLVVLDSIRRVEISWFSSK